MVWNSLDRATTNMDKLGVLKSTPKRNKASLNLITFNKGTKENLNKDIDFLRYCMYFMYKCMY